LFNHFYQEIKSMFSVLRIASLVVMCMLMVGSAAAQAPKPMDKAQAEEKAKVCKGFANIKCAYQALMTGTVEDIKNHEGWAKGEEVATVQAEALRLLKEVETKFESAPDQIKAKELCLSFGYLKQAKLILVNNREETVENHRNWCVEATPKERVLAYAEFFRKIKEYFGEI
jgi:hypothetical protein